ncbi:hypothetical protein R1flu_020247 [Riccia fluitans]|uniref:PHD and RING finger domain-containing protein 1 n=1 Tax=Riccia fluitans TaxID=41844 RepID=A0ABD1ZPH7_9MARC
MARITSRKRRRKSRELNEKGTSSSDSEGGSDDEKEGEEVTEKRGVNRNSVADSKGKGKAIVNDEDDGSMSGSEEMEEDQKSDLQKDVDQVCGICLSEGGMERGKLDCCDHFFCFNCIMEWSKVESRCPMCKQRFVTVTKPAICGVTRSRSRTIRIPTRDQVYEPSEEEIRLFTDPYQNTVCIECHEAGDESLLLLCDRCDAAAHTYCMGLGRSVPRDDWFCQDCLNNLAGSSEDEEELRYIVHDGEDPCATNSPWDMAVLATDIHAERRARSRRSAISTQGARPLRRSTRRLERASRAGSNLMDNLTAESRSGFFPSLVHYGVARTLFRQRQVQATVQSRVQFMRDNWHRLRNGESFFSRVAGDSRGSSFSRRGTELSSVPSSSVTGRTGLSTRNTSSMDIDSGEGSSAGISRAVGRSAEQAEVDRAWAMMDQARQLEARPAGASQSATTSTQSAVSCRSSVAAERPGREGRTQEVAMPRVSEKPAQEAVLPGATSSRGGLEVFLNTRSACSGRGFDVKESTTNLKSVGEDNPPESSSRREVSSSRGGYYLREINQITMNTAKDSCARQAGVSENRSQTEVLQNRSVLDDKDNSRGSSGRSTRRRDTTALMDDRDSLRSSGPSTRRREANKDAKDSTASLSLLKDNSRGFGTSTRRKDGKKERCPERDEEVKQLKQQCYNVVSVELKPFLDSGKIDKRQFKDIARVATHAIFAALDGSESKSGTDVSLGTVICEHEGLTSSDLIPGCCESCVQRHVRKFVKNVVKEKVACC